VEWLEEGGKPIGPRRRFRVQEADAEDARDAHQAKPGLSGHEVLNRCKDTVAWSPLVLGPSEAARASEAIRSKLRPTRLDTAVKRVLVPRLAVYSLGGVVLIAARGGPPHVVKDHECVISVRQRLGQLC